MKLANKPKDKKEKTKKKNGIKPKKEHVLIVAQEIKFARLLSGNEKKTRDRVLKTLKKWLLNCFEKKYEFKEEDFTRVWKGLFYAVWMSDKPLIQEELCDNIAAILDLFPPEQLEYALMMTKAGLKVLATEWYGIDHHRMDKFLMLVRRYLRGSLRCVLRSQWSPEACRLYSHMLSQGDGPLALQMPQYARNAVSMLLHFTDCYLEELSKVSSGDIPPESLTILLSPFTTYMCLGSQPALTTAARRLHTQLLRQSEQGLQYQDKTKAWEKMGCPVGGPEALELASDDDEDEGEEPTEDSEGNSEVPLDPRAGRVDVCLSPLPTPAAALAGCLRALLPQTTSNAYKRTKIFIERFEQLSKDTYPLPVECPSASGRRALASGRGARALMALDKTLNASTDELALRGLGRKHRKRLLAKSRAGLSIVEDVDLIKHAASTATNDNWKIEPTPQQKKQDSVKDNNHTSKRHGKKQTNTPTDKQNNKRKINATNGDVDTKRQKIDQKDTKKVNFKVLNNNKVKNNPKVIIEKKNKPQTNKENLKTTDNVIVEIDKKISAIKTVNANKKIRSKAAGKTEKLKTPTLVVNKVKKFPKADVSLDTPKKVKFVLKNNSMQKPVDYYKSVRQSPSIPFDSTKKPVKTNLKLSSPSPINPFFKKKLKLRK